MIFWLMCKLVITSRIAVSNICVRYIKLDEDYFQQTFCAAIFMCRPSRPATGDQHKITQFFVTSDLSWHEFKDY